MSAPNSIHSKVPMRFSDYFKNNAAPVISFELFPPKTERGLQTLKTRVLPNLIKLNPAYITVTYGAGGSTQGQTLEIASAIKNDHGLEAACHLTCVGASRSYIDTIVRALPWRATLRSIKKHRASTLISRI